MKSPFCVRRKIHFIEVLQRSVVRIPLKTLKENSFYRGTRKFKIKRVPNQTNGEFFIRILFSISIGFYPSIT
ncbi:hypothetical protein LEP1GSC179_3459 [Leptospira santarosai str. MOR084]|uniref:Uncharacterized protein n=1 Tax=Leptospira santarosai str. MOR084 TaxID=1049984 RepID=A0A0E2BGI4_9LEPT|nr:hypothetical protein LEP1GSC179_3459 [Leptospira santarosai str. MOR084]